MKKLLLLLLIFTMLLLVGCNDDVDTPDDIPDDTPTSDYQDPEHKKGTYKVEYVLRSKTVTHFYELSEIPDPPAVESEKNGTVLLVFDGWDAELTPVSGNARYTAKYKSTTYEYTATFAIAGGRQLKVKAIAGQKPIPPKVADHQGMTFVCWDRPLEESLEDVTYTAVYTDVMDADAMAKAYEMWDFVWKNHNYRDLCAAVALYSLVYQEHRTPLSGPIRDRVIAQFEYLTSSKSAPPFDCSVNWSYGVICAALAMAKETPTIWDAMSHSLKAKLDTLMEAFACIVSLGTSDQNGYATGPGFGGNYKNNWNVNYALGNIPCMVFIVHYFGNGDIASGAKAVNDKLKGFDSDEYDRMIRAFNTYGWKNALTCWTTSAPKPGYPDAKEMLVSGGLVAGLDYTDPTGKTIKELGTGKGVNNGGVDFTYTCNISNNPLTIGKYNNITLYEPERIVMAMIDYNFAYTVTSEHYYEGNRVAYILDGTKSPYEGMAGMMYEFGLPNRSAFYYTSHDLHMIVVLMHAAKTLKRYTIEGRERVPVTDNFGNPVSIYDCTEDAERFSRIEVGMEDFIYKYRHGYQDFVFYNQNNIVTPKAYESNAGSGYWVCKCLWRYEIKPLGTLPIAETYD